MTATVPYFLACMANLAYIAVDLSSLKLYAPMFVLLGGMFAVDPGWYMAIWVGTAVFPKEPGLHYDHTTGDRYGNGEIEQQTQEEVWIPST